MCCVYTVEIDSGARYQVCNAGEVEVKIGDWCIIRKDFYLDYARIVHRSAGEGEGQEELPKIERLATVEDMECAAANQEKAKASMRTAAGFVQQLNLEMKLLNAHYTFDCKQITIQFTADGRVDFRELVKELSRALGARIELRQIGVRDETSICGGLGICGQELCCRRFLREFNSINVKMAKDQDLSLTPSTISGVCGRLKCCLKFEHEGYQELARSMPHKGEFCECPDGHGRITDRNLLTQKVSIQLENGNLVHYSVSDITIVQGERSRPKKKDNQNSNGNPSGNNNNNNNPSGNKKKNKSGNNNNGNNSNSNPSGNRNGYQKANNNRKNQPQDSQGFKSPRSNPEQPTQSKESEA